MGFKKISAALIAMAAATSMFVAAGAETFGLAFQTNTYTFRNHYAQSDCVFWDDTWAEEEEEGEYGAGYIADDFSYVDADVEYDGTYTVSVSGIPANNFSETGESIGYYFIKLTSSIAGADYPGIKITIDKVVIDGTEYPEAAGVLLDLDDTTENVKLSLENVTVDNYTDTDILAETQTGRVFVNVLNAYETGLLGAETPFGSDIEVTFTVEGLAEAPADDGIADDDVADDDVADDDIADDDTADDDTADDDTADDNKGDADTGAEGVALVAGVAVLAAGAIIISRKRK